MKTIFNHVKRHVVRGAAFVLLACFSLSAQALDPITASHLGINYPQYPKIDYGTGKQAAIVKRGEYLARAGDCIACHTNVKEGGKPFAGGLPLATPFGTFYSPNITPDKKQGLGKWTFEDFKNAMHHGIRPDGANYFPVFPYIYYTEVSDDDLRAMWAYFQRIPASDKPNKPHDVPFPFNVRLAQYGWKILFFYPYKKRFQYDSKQSAAWNRGKYLVDGLGHCGMCHTPLNPLGAPIRKYYMTGAFIENFWAPNITGYALEGWSAERITKVFTGDLLLRLEGQVAGPMAQVNHDSLMHLTHKDQLAIALYLQSLRVDDPHSLKPKHIKHSAVRGREVYHKACKICHAEGMSGAPKLGDSDSWFIRAKKGKHVLYRHTIYGYNQMPARGACVTCSSEDIESAVDYILEASLTRSQKIALAKPRPKRKATMADGKRIYDRICSTCHAEGRLGAQRLGDKAAWKPVIAKGMDYMIESTIKGGHHKPKRGGCKSCSTGEIIQAVKYMVQKSKTDGDYKLW